LLRGTGSYALVDAMLSVPPCYHPVITGKTWGPSGESDVSKAADLINPTIVFGAGRGEGAAVAVDELAAGLSQMLARPVASRVDASVDARTIRIDFGGTPDRALAPKLDGDALAVTAGEAGIAIHAGSERALIHAAADLMERLGAKFPLGAPSIYPKLDAAASKTIAPYSVVPAFKRRAFVSDIMTWNYQFADRLALHLEHDREFITWMARRGANAFSFIRHAHDTQLKIDELAPLLRASGIDAEYGGHVLQTLMPREEFERHPEYFPAGEDGVRTPRGNLCVSNRRAIEVVRDGALKYAREYPENSLLHIWGADVRRGAWCGCGECRELPPQLQYMEVVNAIAEALEADAAAPAVAYLAYHDTMAPHPRLKPRDNVWFEWAPRERCYRHAINEPECETNRRYLDCLKRHIDLFNGRGHVFEYYADAILFGGLGFATPSVIARDLKCYRALGIESISCLTFGAFSALAYPVNLEAFVRGACDGSLAADDVSSEVAAGRHPRCAAQMTSAYQAIARASRLVLDYGDVVLPLKNALASRSNKREELALAAKIFTEALAASDSIAAAVRSSLVDAERDLWRYSSEVLSALFDYLGALSTSGAERIRMGEAAVARISSAMGHIDRIDPRLKGTWGAYDLTWMREMWFNALRGGLDEKKLERSSADAN
jgi:hypothetical protein